MSDSKGSSGGAGGLGFGGALTVLFVGLKLTDVIAWSWVWVLSPLWISVAAVVAFIVIALGVVTVGAWLAGRQK